jgi:2-keto-4-pentenoate hydratase/2-oxohepta-3-ene-1,7-dioic acid hydratase in catechol pathway
MGPWIVTADEIADPCNLSISLKVNGELRQQGHTSAMIFDIPTLIASLSEGLTLEPGDVIATGTPSGVGYAMTPPCFLKHGDVVECEVEGIGVLSNVFRTASIPHRAA